MIKLDNFLGTGYNDTYLCNDFFKIFQQDHSHSGTEFFPL